VSDRREARGRREGALRRLGIVPSVAELVRAALDDALGRAEVARGAQGQAPPAVVVLDAGCGRNSALARHRARISRFVGVDIHAPAPGALPYLDEFATVDLCTTSDAFPPATFDVVLSSFTVEHFADPGAAFANLARWLRPGGSLVLTTVNRRHPFVAAYLAMPDRLRRRVQPVVKATVADAHPLVGACNDPAAASAAGFEQIRVEAVGHLARAWGRRLPTFVLGVVGDLLARGAPSRRSTLVVTARAPELAA
jgi:SAM-dependent methyltransferase